ncbi:MAG: response regulator [Myxococcota bacterium]
MSIVRALRILVVAADQGDAGFAERVLAERGDRVDIALRVPDAVEHLARGDVDVALVSLSLPRGDGLALVHHLRALYPLVDVIVLTTPQDLEEASHAMALGVSQTVMRPLTGDALLVAVDRARERRILLQQRHELGEEARWGRERTATYARCAAFVAETDQRVVATRILQTCAEEVELAAAAIYAPPFPGAQTYLRSSLVAGGEELPPSLDESALASLDPTQPVQEDEHIVRLLFLGEQDVSACAVLVPVEPITARQREALTVVTSLGTAALTAARKVDAIARTGIKDPDTSAYTFAYFGDVAGREIDRAARHGRRFALMTLGLEGIDTLRIKAGPELQLTLRRMVTDAVLAAVRDSDLLARVEEDEFYLLLPETGLLGALAARRRILARFDALEEVRTMLADVGIDGRELGLVCGISVYPQDGADLGRLLRVSRRRSDRSRAGVWRRLQLADVPFWDALDRVLGLEGVEVGAGGRVSISGEAAKAQDVLSRHVMMPRSVLSSLGEAFTRDAVRHRVPGVIYCAGDDNAATAMVRAMDVPDPGPVRAWVLEPLRSKLGIKKQPQSPAARRLRVDDSRLQDRVLLMGLTELGGYVVTGRTRGDSMLAYHASDLDLVDGLVTALQRTYHLQPEVGMK